MMINRKKDYPAQVALAIFLSFVLFPFLSWVFS